MTVVCKVLVTFIRIALKLNRERPAIIRILSPCFSLPAANPDFVGILLVCFNMNQLFKQEGKNCRTSDKMRMKRILCFYSLIWLRGLYFSFQKKKKSEVNMSECNQNLKAIQAEMISEQRSFRKVLKPIIWVVEHKAFWSFFFFFLSVEGEEK